MTILYTYYQWCRSRGIPHFEKWRQELPLPHTFLANKFNKWNFFAWKQKLISILGCLEGFSACFKAKWLSGSLLKFVPHTFLSTPKAFRVIGNTMTKRRRTDNTMVKRPEPVSLTFHSALRKLNTEPPIGASHQDVVIWLSSYREEDI